MSSVIDMAEGSAWHELYPLWANGSSVHVVILESCVEITSVGHGALGLVHFRDILVVESLFAKSQQISFIDFGKRLVIQGQGDLRFDTSSVSP